MWTTFNRFRNSLSRIIPDLSSPRQSPAGTRQGVVTRATWVTKCYPDVPNFRRALMKFLSATGFRRNVTTGAVETRDSVQWSIQEMSSRVFVMGGAADVLPVRADLAPEVDY